MITLFHSSMEWIFSGAIIFIGIMVFLGKIARGHIFSTVCSVAVWIFVYKLHGMSTAGIMSATFAALLFDAFGIPILKFFSKGR